MPRIVSVRDLRVWQKAMELAMRVFELSKCFPTNEQFALTDQIRRSSRSVPANIAEAWRKRRYQAAFIAKLNDAEGEAVRLPPLALTTVLEDEAGVFDFELRQQSRRALRLEVSAAAGEGDAELQRAHTVLTRYLRSQGLGGVEVEGCRGTPPARGRSGKVQRVVAMPASR